MELKKKYHFFAYVSIHWSPIARCVLLQFAHMIYPNVHPFDYADDGILRLHDTISDDEKGHPTDFDENGTTTGLAIGRTNSIFPFTQCLYLQGGVADNNHPPVRLQH